MPAHGEKICKANSLGGALGLHGGLRRAHLRLRGRLLPLSLPSTGHVALLLLDQTPLSLCKLLSRVLESYCSACESFASQSLPVSRQPQVLGLQNFDLSGGTGSQSNPSGCCPLHHSAVYSITWTTSIVWT